MDNGITFLPNDRYLLENGKFRLYYTAEGDEAHNFRSMGQIAGCDPLPRLIV